MRLEICKTSINRGSHKSDRLIKSSQIAAEAQANGKPISLADHPSFDIIGVRFSDVVELNAIHEEAVRAVKEKRKDTWDKLSERQKANLINAKTRHLIKKSESENARRVRAALEAHGIDGRTMRIKASKITEMRREAHELARQGQGVRSSRTVGTMRSADSKAGLVNTVVQLAQGDYEGAVEGYATNKAIDAAEVILQKGVEKAGVKVLKGVPVVGAAVAGYQAYQKYSEGDHWGALREGLQVVPGAGAAALVGEVGAETAWAVKEYIDPNENLESWFYQKFLK
ncbi:hypothetical protein ACN4EK_14035 [Pantanalinema rosaneae CENA516]|uniref:hypothetical protein n=1 Tax=Pantanalinema rosaneae TaxID=1620701 RepID=UPI003D6DCEC7